MKKKCMIVELNNSKAIIKDLKEKLKFKDNYIEELTKQIKEQSFNHGMASWNTAGFGGSIAIQELVNVGNNILEDKIDINKNEKEHDEIIKLIKGKIIEVKYNSSYKLGDYKLEDNKIYYKDESIFNKRIAKRLYNILETMYNFKLTEGE